jgi:hypothetical protein
MKIELFSLKSNYKLAMGTSKCVFFGPSADCRAKLCLHSAHMQAVKWRLH